MCVYGCACRLVHVVQHVLLLFAYSLDGSLIVFTLSLSPSAWHRFWPDVLSVSSWSLAGHVPQQLSPPHDPAA